MKIDETIKELESYWDEPDGLFWGLRHKGIVNTEKFENFVNLLESIEISGDQINRRLVSLLWFTPLFLTWQVERVLDEDGEVEELENATNQIISILQEKLGAP